jgi:hypothetical protein
MNKILEPMLLPRSRPSDAIVERLNRAARTTAFVLERQSAS